MLRREEIDFKKTEEMEIEEEEEMERGEEEEEEVKEEVEEKECNIDRETIQATGLVRSEFVLHSKI